MLRTLFSSSLTLILRRPSAVLIGCVGVSLIAAWLGAGVELRSSRSELAPVGDPDQRRFDSLLAEFPGTEVVIVAIEADAVSGAELERRGEVLRTAADALAAGFAADPSVERVFHRLDVAWLSDRAPWLVPPESLEALARGVEAEQASIRDALDRPGLAALNHLLAERIEQAAGSGGSFDDVDGARSGLELIRRAVEFESAWLADPDQAGRDLLARPVLEQLGATFDPRMADPYLATRDGGMLLLVVTPRDPGDSRSARRELIDGLRRVVAQSDVVDSGVRVGFAGTMAMAVEEMSLVRRDTRRGAVVAIVGVALLTLLVFRWRTHAWLVLIALGFGVLWSLGAVRLEYGYLNLITSAFVSTLIGVGVAYGIHPMSEYELLGAHTEDPARAVREAFRRTAPAVAAAGLTTSAAFFSILLMKFRGFAELGLVAGVGVLLCLVAALVALPAMMVLHGRRAQRRRAERPARTRRAAIDAVWGDRTTDWICRRPRSVVALAAALTLISALAGAGIGFDTDLMKLMPDGSESVAIQRRVIESSDLSPVFNLAVVESLDALREIRLRAAAEPAIARVESVLDLLPVDPARSARAARRLRAAIGTVALPERLPEFDRAALSASFVRLEAALADAAETAFLAGLGELAGPLESSRAAAESCLAQLAAATPSELARQSAAQQRLWSWARDGLNATLDSLERGPHGVEGIPEALRARLVTSRGRFAVHLHPQGNALDPARLDEYVDASLRVAPQAIGFPFMFRKMSRLVWNGFRLAVCAGALLVTLILWIDLRRWRETALALVPLVVGIIWMLGGMRALGIDFNFANLVALPLVIGVGIDNGVHVIHRVRLEGRAGMGLVLRHTGRAILIASLTTMIGFGSLALASHRGLAGLGTVLLLGVGACLITSTIVLPNLLVVTGRVRR